MKNHKSIVEKIPCPVLAPNNIANQKWCFFAFYSDGSTGLINDQPTKEQINEYKYNFYNIQ